MKPHRAITATLAMAALAVLVVSFCCAGAVQAQPSDCCKGRCISSSVPASLVAVPHAKVRLAPSPLAPTTRTEEASTLVALDDPIPSPLFEPIIQLRI